jgi:ABC-type sugar transport system permease subunit
MAGGKDTGVRTPQAGGGPWAWMDAHLAQLFILPAIVCILSLIAYPAALTVYNSLTNLSMLTMRASKFVWFKTISTCSRAPNSGSALQTA